MDTCLINFVVFSIHVNFFYKKLSKQFLIKFLIIEFGFSQGKNVFFLNDLNLFKMSIIILIDEKVLKILVPLFFIKDV